MIYFSAFNKVIIKSTYSGNYQGKTIMVLTLDQWNWGLFGTEH